MSSEKEPNFFSDDLRSSTDVSDFQAYCQLFERPERARWLGDASVCYLYSKVAAQQIHHYNPHARIVMSLREPVDFIVSYFHKRRSNPREGGESAKSVDEAIRLEPFRSKGECLPAGVEAPAMLLYTARASYVEQVKRFLDLFPRDQIHFAVFEDLTANPDAELRRLGEFLGIEVTDTDFQNRNPSRSVRSRWAFDFLRDLEQGAGVLAPVKAGIKSIVPSNLRNWAKDAAWDYIYSKKKESVISNRLRSELRQQFQSEVQELSQLLDYDFVRRWGYDCATATIGD